MAASGLNRAEREIIAQQVLNRADPGYVRGKIREMADSKRGTSARDNWDYDENVRFCSWLSGQGWVETAQYLEKTINGRQ